MDSVYRWFKDRRGIERETLDAWGVSVADDGTIKVPYPAGAYKFRKGLERDASGGRRFWWEPPTQAGQVPLLPPGFEQGPYMLLLEGESDTWSAFQNASPEWKKSVVGLSGLNAWKDRYTEELFGDAKKVFVVFDNDDPYGPAKAANDKAWREIREALGRKAKRVVLPQGIKDVAEFFMQYDWAAFHVLLKKALDPVRHYPRLDLSKPVPETDWLVEDLLVRKEATVLAADAGVGKSWFSMALALAVAGGAPTFLGQPLQQSGRVLYVDEENTAELVMQRLHALGMAPKHAQNLDYLWYAGVDLAAEPEKLHEEALDIEPELIVIDSLSRVALGVEENSNTEMSMLLRKAIVPLARETGAAVLVLHHTPKEGSGSRGAGAIKAAADQQLSMVRATNQKGEFSGTINLFPSKPRRELTFLKFKLDGSMEKDGLVRLVELTEENDW